MAPDLVIIVECDLTRLAARPTSRSSAAADDEKPAAGPAGAVAARPSASSRTTGIPQHRSPVRPRGQHLGRPDHADGGRPGGLPGRPRCSVPPSWNHLDGHVKVVGLDEQGSVHASLLWTDGNGVLELLSSPAASTDRGLPRGGPDGSGQGGGRLEGPDRLAERGLGPFPDSPQPPGSGPRPDGGLFPVTTSPNEALVLAEEGFLSRIALPRREKRHRVTT